jgi:hypothetical protein
MNKIKKQVLEYIESTNGQYDLYLINPSENCPGFPQKWEGQSLVLVTFGYTLPIPVTPHFQDERISVILSFDRIKTHVFIPYSTIFMVNFGTGAIQFYDRVSETKEEKPKFEVLKGGLN